MDDKDIRRCGWRKTNATFRKTKFKWTKDFIVDGKFHGVFVASNESAARIDADPKAYFDAQER